MFRRKPYAELVERQLDLVATDDGLLLVAVADARRAYTDADREDAEEAFGDYQLALEGLKDRLVEIRDTYAGTLDDPGPYDQGSRQRFAHPPSLALA